MTQGANRPTGWCRNDADSTAALTPHHKYMYAAPQQPSSYSHQPAAGLLHLLQQTCHHCTCTCTCTRTLSLSFQLTHGWASTQQVHSKTHTHTTFVRVVHQQSQPRTRRYLQPLCAPQPCRLHQMHMYAESQGTGSLRRQCCCTERKATKKVHHQLQTAPHRQQRECAGSCRAICTHPSQHTVHTAARRVTALYTTRQPVRRIANRQTATHPTHHTHILEPHLPQAGTAHSLAHSRVASQQQPTDSTAQRVARQVSFGACLERHSSSVHVLCTVQGEAVVQRSARRRPCPPPGTA